MNGQRKTARRLIEPYLTREPRSGRDVGQAFEQILFVAAWRRQRRTRRIVDFDQARPACTAATADAGNCHARAA